MIDKDDVFRILCNRILNARSSLEEAIYRRLMDEIYEIPERGPDGLLSAGSAIARMFEEQQRAERMMKIQADKAAAFKAAHPGWKEYTEVTGIKNGAVIRTTIIAPDGEERQEEVKRGGGCLRFDLGKKWDRSKALAYVRALLSDKKSTLHVEIEPALNGGIVRMTWCRLHEP